MIRLIWQSGSRHSRFALLHLLHELFSAARHAAVPAVKVFRQLRRFCRAVIGLAEGPKRLFSGTECHRWLILWFLWELLGRCI